MLASTGARLALPVAVPVTAAKLHVLAWLAGVQTSAGALLHLVLPLSEHVPAVPAKAAAPFMTKEPAMAACLTLMVAMTLSSVGPRLQPDRLSTTVSAPLVGSVLAVHAVTHG